MVIGLKFDYLQEGWEVFIKMVSGGEDSSDRMQSKSSQCLRGLVR